MKRPLLVILAALLVACPKDKPAEVDASAAAPPASAAEADAAAEAAAANAPSSYEGKYTSAPSSLYIPDEKDYASVKQAKDDATKMVGEGAFVLAVDGDGRVSGTIDSGPASPAIIDGVVSAGTVTGTVRRKDPADDGLTGSIVGKIGPEGIDGTMTLSDANASVLREAKFTAKKK
jgi:hypothetical protein